MMLLTVIFLRQRCWLLWYSCDNDAGYCTFDAGYCTFDAVYCDIPGTTMLVTVLSMLVTVLSMLFTVLSMLVTVFSMLFTVLSMSFTVLSMPFTVLSILLSLVVFRLCLRPSTHFSSNVKSYSKQTSNYSLNIFPSSSSSVSKSQCNNDLTTASLSLIHTSVALIHCCLVSSIVQVLLQEPFSFPHDTYNDIACTDWQCLFPSKN